MQPFATLVAKWSAKEKMMPIQVMDTLRVALVWLAMRQVRHATRVPLALRPLLLPKFVAPMARWHEGSTVLNQDAESELLPVLLTGSTELFNSKAQVLLQTDARSSLNTQHCYWLNLNERREILCKHLL